MRGTALHQLALLGLQERLQLNSSSLLPDGLALRVPLAPPLRGLPQPELQHNNLCASFLRRPRVSRGRSFQSNPFLAPFLGGLHDHGDRPLVLGALTTASLGLALRFCARSLQLPTLLLQQPVRPFLLIQGCLQGQELRLVPADLGSNLVRAASDLGRAPIHGRLGAPPRSCQALQSALLRPQAASGPAHGRCLKLQPRSTLEHRPPQGRLLVQGAGVKVYDGSQNPLLLRERRKRSALIGGAALERGDLAAQSGARS